MAGQKVKMMRQVLVRFVTALLGGSSLQTQAQGQ